MDKGKEKLLFNLAGNNCDPDDREKDDHRETELQQLKIKKIHGVPPLSLIAKGMGHRAKAMSNEPTQTASSRLRERFVAQATG